MNFLVVNGPNLNLLGTREPDIYGSDTLPELERRWRRHGARLGVGVRTFQSNHEGAIIDQLHGVGRRSDGVVLNAGALSHTSYAIHDALVAIEPPVVEVHISNILEREPWRATSVTAPAAARTIMGRGPVGYLNAIDHLWASMTWQPEIVAYGAEADQRIEVRIPKRARGVAILLHGGFWRTLWASDIMDPLAVRLAQDGWVTANVEYRRGEASFADATSDVRTAVDATRFDLEARGLGDLPVTLIGHSAGGYLAVHAAAGLDDVSVVGLAPVLDLAGISAARPDDDPVRAFLGGSPSDDPALWREASVAQRAPARLTILHGSLDDSVPVAHSEAFGARHPHTDLRRLDGVDHMSLIDPGQDLYAEIIDAVEAATT